MPKQHAHFNNLNVQPWESKDEKKKNIFTIRQKKKKIVSCFIRIFNVHTQQILGGAEARRKIGTT